MEGGDCRYAEHSTLTSFKIWGNPKDLRGSPSRLNSDNKGSFLPQCLPEREASEKEKQCASSINKINSSTLVDLDEI